MNVLELLIDTHSKVRKIEGQMSEILKLPDRVSMLEQGQAWLKGGWAFLTAGYAYLFGQIFGK